MKLSIVAISGVLLSGTIVAQDGPALSPKTLRAALAARPAGADADRLAERIRAYFGGHDALVKGGAAKIDELDVAWAIEAPGLPSNVTPRVSADVGNGFNVPLTAVGASGLYAGVVTLSHGTALTWHYEVGDRRAGGGQLEVYETHPDSREQPGVPKGALKQMPP